MSVPPARLMIYETKVEFDNPCTQHHFGLLTPENMQPYSHNPTICKFMIQLGRFDELGSGVRNINHYLPLYAHGAKPEFKEDKQMFRLTLPLDVGLGAQSGAQSTEILVALTESAMTASELMNLLGLQSKTGAFKRTIKGLIASDHIEYTIPEKPNSRLQKYRLTETGRKI